MAFLGHLTLKQIEQELRRCAVVVIPEQYENMSPLLMIEAMTLARPIVISRAGGIPEFIEDGVTGWLAAPRRPDEFAEKILYCSEALRRGPCGRAGGAAEGAGAVRFRADRRGQDSGVWTLISR